MSLPIYRIISAKTDLRAHADHLHVEGSPFRTGTPPLNFPGWTSSLIIIKAALDKEFGFGEYFLDTDGKYVKGAAWTHMGVYNRRKIAGSTTWSQHAFANALDIGPYIGQKAQQPFYDFLTRANGAKLEDMFTKHEIDVLKELVAAVDDRGSNGFFAGPAIDLIRKERVLPLHKQEKAAAGPHKHKIEGRVEFITGEPL